jgi:hypothetical protein
MRLTQSKKIWLSRIPDWTSPQQLAGDSPRAACGIAKALSDLVKMGFAEWRCESASEFRITDAGREAIRNFAHRH